MQLAKGVALLSDLGAGGALEAGGCVDEATVGGVDVIVVVGVAAVTVGVVVTVVVVVCVTSDAEPSDPSAIRPAQQASVTKTRTTTPRRTAPALVFGCD